MTKMLLPNQCTPLHFLYGRDDCCLCKALTRIDELEAEIEKLKDSKPVDYGNDDGYKERLANPDT